MEQQDEDLYSITGGPLKPHEYVLIKPIITAGDEAWIQNHSAKMRGKNKKDTEIVLTIGDVELALLQRMIKGWSLTKPGTHPHTGEPTTVPIPFSMQAIEELPRKISKYIYKKINELNPDEEEEEEEKKAFLTAVVDSSEDNFQAERVLRLKS